MSNFSLIHSSFHLADEQFLFFSLIEEKRIVFSQSQDIYDSNKSINSLISVLIQISAEKHFIGLTQSTRHPGPNAIDEVMNY